eukprot:2158466-Pleurochrysis_carterae.AAC.1
MYWAPAASRRERAGSERSCGRGRPSRSRRFFVFIGIVAQAVKKRVKRRRVEPGTFRRPIHGRLCGTMDLQNVELDNHDGVIVNTNS